MKCEPWTKDQIAILKANPVMPIPLLSALLAEAGPKRTANGIDSKRTKLGIGGRRSCCLPKLERQSGWPVTPAPEYADRVFVDTVVRAMRAEGLIRGVSA